MARRPYEAFADPTGRRGYEGPPPKRRRTQSEEDDDDAPPPPFLSMLDLGISEGQFTVGNGPPPARPQPGDVKRPNPPDPDRYIVDEVGYIRDRDTGELLPGEASRMPYHTLALRMEEEAWQRWWEENEDAAFARFQTGLNHNPITEAFQTLGAEQRVRAEARLKMEEDLRQKLLAAGAAPLVRELEVCCRPSIG